VCGTFWLWLYVYNVYVWLLPLPFICGPPCPPVCHCEGLGSSVLDEGKHNIMHYNVECRGTRGPSGGGHRRNKPHNTTITRQHKRTHKTHNTQLAIVSSKQAKQSSVIPTPTPGRRRRRRVACLSAQPRCPPNLGATAAGPPTERRGGAKRARGRAEAKPDACADMAPNRIRYTNLLNLGHKLILNLVFISIHEYSLFYSQVL